MSEEKSTVRLVAAVDAVAACSTLVSGEATLMPPVRLYNGRLQYWDDRKDIWGGYVDAPIVTEEET